MTHNRLNHQIHRHACSVAEEVHKNWAYSIGELLKNETNNFDFRPASDCNNGLLYYKEALIRLHEEQWHEDINHISM